MGGTYLMKHVKDVFCWAYEKLMSADATTQSKLATVLPGLPIDWGAS
eukprot:NODE_1922_length_529_cov_319.131250_g1563_i0.p1 GENE.NODE_1922_length_529_cov_319.131250_g1563_i0~~NODE_1922_length_529_cov_319.131250_g1563_i0.p1  ORF type:complete len:57 (+),score=21.72 NODE_1922_length_529_cov_319.131250_g1563_i0:32-172(+)